MNNLERDCSETEKQEIRVDVKSVKVAWPRSKQEPFVCSSAVTKFVWSAVMAVHRKWHARES